MTFQINSDATVRKNPWDYARLESDIMIVEDAMSLADCNKCIEAVNSIPNAWDTSITAGEFHSGKLEESRKRVSDQFLVGVHANSHPALIRPLDNAFFLVFNSAVQTYSKLLGERFAVDQDEGYSILRYSVGGKYDYHSDNGGASQGILRTLSALLYLNDGYEGGEVDFPRQQVCIKPKAGMLVMFPAIANFKHASLPIVSGTKYTVVTWFR